MNWGSLIRRTGHDNWGSFRRKRDGLSRSQTRRLEILRFQKAFRRHRGGRERFGAAASIPHLGLASCPA
jgi:hypothetical protein